MAEETGFEPAIVLLPYTLSKRAPSTTRPLFLTITILTKNHTRFTISRIQPL